MIKGKMYEINEKNLKNHEMIGLKVKIVDSTDPKRIGEKGSIVDETKNTFILEMKEKMPTGNFRKPFLKVFPKKECVFEFDINKKVIVNGAEIEKRPEERLK
jgi:ribonuclease P protein subunit POP4